MIVDSSDKSGERRTKVSNFGKILERENGNLRLRGGAKQEQKVAKSGQRPQCQGKDTASLATEGRALEKACNRLRGS